MERRQRIGLIVVAVVIAAVAIVLIQSGGGDEDDDAATVKTVQTQPEEPTGTVKAPTPPPEPEFQKVVIKGGAVKGGEQEITANKGDTVRIEVTSDTPDEVHLHGYDIEKEVAPGKPARFELTADIEGEFEMEAHHIGDVTVATLVVEP